MSTSPDIGIELEDLELQLLPAWAKQSPDTNRYARFEGDEKRSGPRRRERPESGGRRFERSPGGDQRGQRGPRERRSGQEGRLGRPLREERREPLQPLPELSVTIVPEEKGVEALARQIKLAGRAYPIFEVAHLILRKPDRYHITFGVVKKPEGQIAQPLWLCNLDDTIWLTEPDAVNQVLQKHFDTFYQAEKTPTDPPKGTYTFVGQCGLSGVILGPPNYHDYQNKLRKLHAERFSRMPFDVYKSKVRIVKDEAVVKKWVEEQSWKIEYNCLNVPEPKKLGSREEVEKHFREVHLANIVRTVESHTLPGTAAQQLPAAPLRQLVRHAWEEQHRFPLKVVTVLSQQFAAHGLQFFKVNKTITHVAVARPHYLDLEATPVSDGVKRIVDFINATPRCTRKRLIESLAPSPAPAPPAEAPGPVSPEQPAAKTQGNSSAAAEPTPEQTALSSDLHWLIHQGHVIEFANGRLETARKPNPRPSKPEAKSVEKATEAIPSAEATVKADAQSQSAAEASASGGEAERAAGAVDGATASPAVEPSAPVPPDSDVSVTEGAPVAQPTGEA